MSDTEQNPWSDNPNAPKIPHDVYFSEKIVFAGLLIAAVLYGVLAVLFFQCMAALLSPVNRKREGIRWGLVCYTVVMFACATVVIGTAQNLSSLSFIDNREFPGIKGSFPPGPTGYQAMTCSGKAGLAPDIGFLLNYWLADGLLLYRCYIIYGRKLWIIAFPFLLYLGTLALGFAIIITMSCVWGKVKFILPFMSVSVSLNVLLTLMIVVRLVLHGRNVCAATGSRTGISGLYKTLATMLIESSALYAVNSLALIGLWATGSSAVGLFLPTIADTQVIAALLIVQRVANRSALTSNTIVTGNTSTLNITSRGETTCVPRPLSGVYPMGSVTSYEKNASGLGVHGVETPSDLRRDCDSEV